MDEVSVVRLYVLRATYLLLVIGVGTMIWPLLLGTPEAADHFRGVTWFLEKYAPWHFPSVGRANLQSA